jgi:hypothetical protein
MYSGSIVSRLSFPRTDTTARAAALHARLHAKQATRRKGENRQAALRDILLGGAICLVGVVITIYTYSTASNAGGGRYVVAWGAILFGGIQFLKGLVGLAMG